jgi:hypothetical protein
MKRISMVLSTILLSCLLCAPVVVNAQSDETTDTTTVIVEKARGVAQEKRKDKQARVDEIKQEVAARKLKVKQSVCDKNEARLNAMIPRVSKNAENIKAVIDKHYLRVQEFYASGKLTTPDYETLVAAIELAKANAEASLETVSTYVVDIDCESETAGEELDSFRTSASQAKEDLKTYRKEVVALISALKSANANENKTDDSDSSDEDESENETEEGEEAETNE